MRRLRSTWCRYVLDFNFEARTSRGSMLQKETFFIKLWYEDAPELYGIGECALFRGLSCDDVADYEQRLDMLCRHINATGVTHMDIRDYPSICFGLETAARDLNNGGCRKVFDGSWIEGRSSIIINGLVWMGSKNEMRRRIDEKLEAGFRCMKMKIGGVAFDDELRLLEFIRKNYDRDVLTLRLDANGAFTPENALNRLESLSKFGVHSIEQPIKAGQWDAMRRIAAESPIDIVLDEELIGLNDNDSRRRMLDAIMPRYIILKPALCGGFSGATEWIGLAEERSIGWWVTSALESNIGLNAIAQWTASLKPSMPQGLGTGMLYTNNIVSPMFLDGDRLCYNPDGAWAIPDLPWIVN